MSVTQADHEAADQWKREWEHCWGSHTALVAAFADHRLAERARAVTMEIALTAIKSIGETDYRYDGITEASPLDLARKIAAAALEKAATAIVRGEYDR